MAELILTEEEKKAKWSELSDEAIGKFVKKSIFKFEEGVDIDEDRDPWYIKVGLLFLVNRLVEMNVRETTAEFTGVTSGDVYGGDWVITLSRVDDGTPKTPQKGSSEKHIDVTIQANELTPGARLSTAWGLFKSCCSALFLGKLKLVVSKNLNITEFHESRG